MPRFGKPVSQTDIGTSVSQPPVVVEPAPPVESPVSVALADLMRWTLDMQWKSIEISTHDSVPLAGTAIESGPPPKSSQVLVDHSQALVTQVVDALETRSEMAVFRNVWSQLPALGGHGGYSVADVSQVPNGRPCSLDGCRQLRLGEFAAVLWIQSHEPLWCDLRHVSLIMATNRFIERYTTDLRQHTTVWLDERSQTFIDMRDGLLRLHDEVDRVIRESL